MSALTERLHAALMHAFPSPDALRIMLKFKLNLNLDEVSGRDDLSAVTFRVIEHVNARVLGGRRALLHAARAANGENSALRELAREWPRLAAEESLTDAVRDIPTRASGAPGDEIGIILSTYSPNESADELALFQLSAADVDRARWEETFGAGKLTKIREALATRADTRDLRFTLACAPGVAVRAGCVFHRRTGFRVSAFGAPGSVGGSIEFRADVPADVVVDSPEYGVGEEVHVLVSATHDTAGLYQKWRKELSSEPFVVLRLTPAGGISSTSIRDGAHAAAWASELRAALVAAGGEAARRGVTIRAKRLFLAGPAALACAIGRELNAFGRIIVMNHDKGTDRYVTSFDFFA